MNYVTKDLAAQMEGCIGHTHRQVSKQYSIGKVMEINGGAACFAGLDSYLSQVVGWGFNTTPKQFKSEIRQIESFYKTLDHQRVDIELCPFVGNELPIFLSERGYVITELNNVSVLNLNSYNPIPEAAEPFRIQKVMPVEFADWATKVALGFGCPEAQSQFYHYVQAAGVHAFAAYDQNVIIAGGLVSVCGDFCDLGVTSTLPAYRSHGIQKKLVQQRLGFARDLGASWALVTTEPGTISDVNMQKAGFHCAYTRIKMTQFKL